MQIKEVYLYCSFAKGEIYEGSDINFLIVGNFKERFFDRIGKILDLTDLPIELLVYSAEEFEGLKESENPFIAEALNSAVRLL